MGENNDTGSEQNPKDSKFSFLMLILLCLSLSIGSGILSGWWFSERSPGNKEVVVLDVGSIVEAKRKEFIEKFKGREASPELKKEMEKEISLFTGRLNQIIEIESRGKVILVRDSVLSGERDITDEVARKVNESH